MLALNYFLKSEPLKSLANGFAFLIFVTFLLSVFRQPVTRLNIGYVLTLALLIFGMLFNVIQNLGETDIADYLKMLLSPLFFFIGYFAANLYEFSGSERGRLFRYTLMLLLIPSLITVGELLIWGDRFREDELNVSIFANRNNAALYAIVLSILFAILKLHRRWIICYLLLVSVLFSTLGVVFAVMLGIIIAQVRRGNILHLALYFIPLATALFILMYAVPSPPIFERLLNVSEGLKYLYLSGQVWNLSHMSYGEMSEVMGNSDISLFFRIAHWAELWEIYSNGSLLTMLFGHGVGSSVRMSAAGLVPHNDYLRYLFECGFVSFLGFFVLNLRIIKDAGSSYVAIPLTTIIIYFFSENLINNFLAMMLFYFLAGFVIAQRTLMRRVKARYEYFASQPELFRLGRL